MSIDAKAVEALPELPVPEECFKTGDLPYGDAEYECAFSAEQMHAYALAALAATAQAPIERPANATTRFMAIYGYETWALPNGILTTKPTIGFDNIRIDYVVGQKPVVSLEEKQ